MNNSSPLRIAFAVGGIVIAFMLFWWLGKPYLIDKYFATRNRLQETADEIEAKQEAIEQFAERQHALAVLFKDQSLPPNADSAAAQYGQLLKPLLKACNLQVDNFKPPESVRPTPSSGNKKGPQHIILPFDVRAKGTLPQLAQALEMLQRLPVAHRVKTLEVDRIESRNDKDKGTLAIHMVIEAMVVAGANNTKPLPSVDSELAKAKTDRLYSSDMKERNPFIGLVPVKITEPEPPKPPPVIAKGPDPREYILIDTITYSSGEANLRNKLFNTKLRLQTSSKQGYNTFRITNEDGDHTWVKGKVLKIDPRDVYFQVGEEVFGFHFGQSMADAMSHPLTETEISELSLTKLIDPEFAGTEKKSSSNSKRPSTTSGPSKKGR